MVQKPKQGEADLVTQNKTGIVKQLIVRHIRDNFLVAGDALPSIEFFREKFDCGTTTVSRAINELRDEGVVRIRNRVGVFVEDPYVGGNFGRTVGISIYHPDALASNSSILSALELELNIHGCGTRLFVCPCELVENEYEFSLFSFPGLRNAVETRSIDALIHLGGFDKKSMDFLREHRMPELFAGFLARGNKNFAVWDYEQILNEMCDSDVFRTAKRPVIFPPPSAEKVLLEVMKKRSKGKPFMVIPLPRLLERGTVLPSRTAVEKIVSLPADQRPDLVISFSTGLVNALLFQLALALPGEKLPSVMMICRKDTWLTYPPVPEMRTWVLDEEAFAREAVHRLLETLRNNGTDVGRISVKPQIYCENLPPIQKERIGK